MNEDLKKFTADLAKELQTKLQAPEVKEFVDKVKASGDDRTFEVVMSTSDEDRQGDELDQSRWDFKYFNMNPVLLWAHNYSGFPIGIITDIEIRGDEAIATGKFAPEGINPDADMACALYQQKILRAVSPGYIQNDDGTRELLEVSFCAVPAGRYALSMRQVSALGVSTRELVTKGFFYENKDSKPVTKTPQVGDTCEADDGSPGVLADDENNPGTMVCVPTEQKGKKSNNNDDMNELTKAIEAEHGRHGEAVGKAIDEFKGIDEFKSAIDGENADHLEKCMKAIDDSYETMGREPNKPEKAHKKSIDEFKSEMTDEHLTHVKNVDKAIEEFKSIDEFTKSAGEELSRHKDASMDMCKAEADRMGEGESDEEKAMREAIEKSGRAISAATGEKISAIIKALEDHNAEHQTSTTTAIASLKDLMGSPQDDEGKETKQADAPAPSPKPRSSTSGASELESYIFNQRLARQVKTAAEEVLRQVNPKIKELTSRGR